MRVEICYEDAIQYQWFLVKNSIQIPDEAPFCWNYDFQRLPLGKAKDFRREDDNGVTVITAELEIFDDKDRKLIETFLKNEDAEISMYANHVADQRFEDLRVVWEATLRAVVLVMIPSFPKIPEGGLV